MNLHPAAPIQVLGCWGLGDFINPWSEGEEGRTRLPVAANTCVIFNRLEAQGVVNPLNEPFSGLKSATPHQGSNTRCVKQTSIKRMHLPRFSISCNTIATLTLCVVENNSWQLLVRTWLKETVGLVVHSSVMIRPNFQNRILVSHPQQHHL